MTLSKNIAEIEVAVQEIIRRGEQANPLVEAGLEKIDDGLQLLHKANRSIYERNRPLQ